MLWAKQKQSTKFYIVAFSFIIINITSLFSCARIVAPEGGPKDITPPKVEVCSPPQKALSFSGNKLKIKFDEYIVLKDFNQQFMSSPPLKQTPKAILNGKTLTLKWKNDTLKPNTTYTFWFRKAITDFRSGNTLDDLKYTFSTGQQLDSLSLGGTILNAKTLEPEKDVWVLLYTDSANTPLQTKIADYLSKTDEEGHFKVVNLPSKSFYITALKDVNKNLLFDLNSEELAFSNTLFEAHYSPQDSLKNTQDSLNVASHEPDVTLFLFQEFQQNCYLSSSERKKDHLLQFIFNQPNDSLPQIQLEGANEAMYLLESNSTKDSINVFLCDSALIKSDTITAVLDYYKTDTSFQLKKTQEKVYLAKAVSESKTDESEKNSYLTFEKTASSQAFFKPFVLNSSFPIKQIDLDKIHLFKKEKEEYNIQNKPLKIELVHLKQMLFDYDLKENTSYKIELLPGAVKDYLGRSNDTTTILFKSNSELDYASIKLKIRAVKKRNTLVQLLNDKEQLISSFYTQKDSVFNIPHLKVQKYIIRCFFDDNGNHHWDTGNYSLRQQAEKVIQYPKEIPTKGGFTQEIVWDLKQEE